MLVLVCVLAGCSALLGGSASWAAQRLAPGLAVRLVTGTGAVAAAGWCWALLVLASTVVGQVPAVAQAGAWSPGQLARLDPVPVPLGWAAVAAVAALAVAGVWVTRRRLRGTWSCWQACRSMPTGAGRVVVVADDIPQAVAVPGLRGRVVVSRGMLRALDAGQRRVLLAHERSHLRHRHDLWVSGAWLAASVDPLLIPLARAVGAAVERWADEDAAREAGDRAVAAETVARAALATARAGRLAGRPAGVALAGAAGQVAGRVDALLAPPPRPRPRLVAVLAAVALIAALAAVAAGYRADQLFEAAIRDSHHLAMHQ